MKKLALTVAIVLTMGLGAYAQNGGLLGFGDTSEDYVKGDNTGLTTPSLPSTFGSSDDQDGNVTPLGSGIAVLVGLGAAYAFGKKRKD